MKKLILPTFLFFILSLTLPVSTAYADTVLLDCPPIMRPDSTELTYDAPLMASKLPEIKSWGRESTSLTILYCESSSWVPYTDLMYIGYTLSISRLGVNEETDYADYSEESVQKPFGNGRAYFRGTPYGGSSSPSMTLIDKAGSCEIVFGAGVSPTEAGQDLYVRSEPTAPMLAEYQRNAERMTREMTEAINKLKTDIAANQELAGFCAPDGIPIPRPETSTQTIQEPRLPFVEKWMSIESKERVEVVKNEVNDWIIENVGVYEPSMADFNETPLQDREPQIKPGKPPSDSPFRQMIEEELAAGGIVSNYEDGVLIEGIYRGSWLYFSPTAVVRYSPELGRRIFEVRKGEVEVKTEENTIEVETPDAKVKSKGTHYWVAYDPDQKTTTVGVYEGEIEITPKGGKPVILVPDGEKPGVLVISQKISIAKILLLSVVISAILAGLTLLIKRKGLLKLPQKKFRK